MKLAPIILFVYNRPWHTEQTLRALMANELAAESELYIYADGPKPNATEEQLQKIHEVRQLIRQEQWCGKVHIVESEKNKGLADSIIGGVTEIVNKHSKIIVLEDDIIPTTGFLRYMNDALEMYKDDEQVMHVSGYIYPHTSKIKTETLFLKVYSCWGWGTWQRAWKNFEPDVNVHLQHYSTQEEIRYFDINGHMPNYWQLEANKTGEIYTWAVKWYASWLWAGGYALFPRHSLVYNAGFDGTGEHCSNNDRILNCETIRAINMERIPIIENVCVRLSIDKIFKQNRRPKTMKKWIGYILTQLRMYNLTKDMIDTLFRSRRS